MVWQSVIVQSAIFFLIGCVCGGVAARAAHKFREGMGVGLWEPFVRIFMPRNPVPGNFQGLLRHSFTIQPETAAFMLIGGAVFFLVFASFSSADNAVYWNLGLASLLIVISAVDQRQSFIPDSMVFLLLALGFLRAWSGDASLESAAIGLLVAYLISVAIQTFFDLLGREGFYWGDLKYAIALGVWFGFPAIALILFIASFLGLVYGLASRQRIFPFAPLMSVGALIVLVAEQNFLLTPLWLAPL